MPKKYKPTGKNDNAVKIIKMWKEGAKQIEIAKKLGIGAPYVSMVLDHLKNPTPPPVGTYVPREIIRLFDRLSRNVEKTWGFDNKQGREKGRPKYRNLYEDWQSFSEWFQDLLEPKN